ncbi:unnamed protein product [Ilex paraguariensis]|uniref:Uncharacterized protein n=1 Tax=Ilex paraguariensis TaxID=185542 RepID=A0ABC8RBP4_9AQUA
MITMENTAAQSSDDSLSSSSSVDDELDEHMDNATGPLCACGAGHISVFRARTTRNDGSYFYRYPFGKDHRNAFI